MDQDNVTNDVEETPQGEESPATQDESEHFIDTAECAPDSNENGVTDTEGTQDESAT